MSNSDGSEGRLAIVLIVAALFLLSRGCSWFDDTAKRLKDVENRLQSIENKIPAKKAVDGDGK